MRDDDKNGEGMAICQGGEYAVCIDEKNPTYGWVHQRINDNWVTVRKATEVEIANGKTAYESCKNFWADFGPAADEALAARSHVVPTAEQYTLGDLRQERLHFYQSGLKKALAIVTELHGKIGDSWNALHSAGYDGARQASKRISKEIEAAINESSPCALVAPSSIAPSVPRYSFAVVQMTSDLDHAFHTVGDMKIGMRIAENGAWIRADELLAVSATATTHLLDEAGKFFDWGNAASVAMKNLLDAYERRIRSLCTPEQLEQKPWECAEFIEARRILNAKPNWIVTTDGGANNG